MNTMQEYFFSEKEYIAHLDNLLYMLHQIQKLPKYSKIQNRNFFNMFKEEICKYELNAEIAKEAIFIDNTFNMDLIFFIAAYICFDGDVFEKFCMDLSWRL